MGSLSPWATSDGLSIAEARSRREWFGCPGAYPIVLAVAGGWTKSGMGKALVSYGPRVVWLMA
jgi:hypothetical protein